MKWEYHVLTVVKDFRLIDIQMKLDALGEEGWEMVAVGNGTIYFKRPKPISE